MSELVIRPGKATLANWQAVLEGAALRLDPSCRDKVAAGAAATATPASASRASAPMTVRARIIVA